MTPHTREEEIWTRWNFEWLFSNEGKK